MKKIFLIIILCIFNINLLNSQNKLNEGDFEAGAGVWGCRHYDDINNRFSFWKTRFSNKALYRKRYWHPKLWLNAGKRKNPSGYDEDPKCPCGAYHSPDYRGAANGQQGYYIGIGQYELIQQKLTSTNKLEEGKIYKVSCKVMVPEFFNGSGHVTESSERYMIFFLAKNKVKYKRQGREFTGNSNGENLCNANNVGFGYIHPYNSKYKNYKSNDTIMIKKLLLNNYEYNIWYDVEFAFIMPEEGVNKHDWFVIDCIDDGSCGDYFCTNYAYIDDITLEETDKCNTEDPCSSTDGKIIPNWIRWVDFENYSDLVIDGLENVSQATNIKINDILGNEIVNIPDKYCPKGIDYVHWDGKSSYGGVIAAGSYIWEMDLKNDCENKHLAWRFSYLSPNNYYPSLGDNFVCNQSIIQPIPCCEAEQNIFIENETIEGGGEVYFHAVNNLTVRNTLIKSTAKDVVFKAGNQIILEEGFETEVGANVEMLIEPCDNTNKEKKDSIADKQMPQNVFPENLSNLIQNEPNDLKKNNHKTIINIFPNPANKYTEISTILNNCSSYQSEIKISITDISGKIIYDKQFTITGNYFSAKINTSNFPSGIYFINFTGNNFSETEKLIVQ